MEATGVSLSGLTLTAGPEASAAAQQNPRAVLFSNFKRYLASELAPARVAVAKADARVASIELLEPKTVSDFTAKDELLRAASASANDAASLLDWLSNADGFTAHKQRTAMAVRPSWAYAGDLLELAGRIEDLVSQTAPLDRGNGAKDDLPLVYVSNPPRHGKSLLLDSLFPDGKSDGSADVCVLNATYNAGTPIDRETDLGATATCALRGLLLRLLNDLVFGRPDWREVRERNSPLMTAEYPVQVYQAKLICRRDIELIASLSHIAGFSPDAWP